MTNAATPAEAARNYAKQLADQGWSLEFIQQEIFGKFVADEDMVAAWLGSDD